MDVNEQVSVRLHFDGGWSNGFEISRKVPSDSAPGSERYELRRTNDGALLPRLFSTDELRAANARP